MAAPSTASLPLRALCGALVVSALAACGAPYKVVQKSGPPSALAGTGRVGVEFDYSTLTVDGMSEEAWVAHSSSEKPEYPADWAKLKAQVETNVLAGLSDGDVEARKNDTSGAPTVVVAIEQFQMGRYIVIGAIKHHMNVKVSFVVDGAVTDTITFAVESTPSLYSPSVWQHLDNLGKAIGQKAAHYVRANR